MACQSYLLKNAGEEAKPGTQFDDSLARHGRSRARAREQMREERVSCR